MTELEKEMFEDMLNYAHTMLNTCEQCDAEDVFGNDDYQIMGKLRYILRHCAKTLQGIVPTDVVVKNSVLNNSSVDGLKQSNLGNEY